MAEPYALGRCRSVNPTGLVGSARYATPPAAKLPGPHHTPGLSPPRVPFSIARGVPFSTAIDSLPGNAKPLQAIAESGGHPTTDDEDPLGPGLPVPSYPDPLLRVTTDRLAPWTGCAGIVTIPPPRDRPPLPQARARRSPASPPKPIQVRPAGDAFIGALKAIRIPLNLAGGQPLATLRPSCTYEIVIGIRHHRSHS